MPKESLTETIGGKREKKERERERRGRDNLKRAKELGCRGGGVQVVRVLFFKSLNPSSNPAEANGFSVKVCFKRTKINTKRRPYFAHFKRLRERERK